METIILQEVEMKILRNDECQKLNGEARVYNATTWSCEMSFWSFDLKPDLLSGEQLCAMAPGKSGCVGDSGAPLTVIKNQRHYLAGVLSWGIDCKSVSSDYNKNYETHNRGA